MTPSPNPSLTIRPMRDSDATGIQSLFANYPYKQAQRVIQKLDRDRLNALYWSSLEKSAKSGDPVWVAEYAGGVVACAGLSPDTWHSEIYGMKMGKIQPWLNYSHSLAGQALLTEVLKEASEKNYRHVSVRMDGGDFQNLHLFESRGFQLVDVSMKYSLPMPLELSESGAADDPRIRLARPEDATWMRELGSKTHANTHFLNDPALPAEKTHHLFDAWVARCIEKLAYRIYVLEDETKRGRGFVIYLRNSGFKQAVGRAPIILDYVVIDPELRGVGAGPRLVRESLRRERDSGFDFCELRTSSHNTAAIVCYEKLGFRLCATDFVLHAVIENG